MLLVELKGETLFRKKKKELKKKENKLQNTAHKEGYLFTLWARNFLKQSSFRR